MKIPKKTYLFEQPVVPSLQHVTKMFNAG